MANQFDLMGLSNINFSDYYNNNNNNNGLANNMFAQQYLDNYYNKRMTAENSFNPITTGLAGLQALTGLGNLFLSNKSYGLANKNFNFQKDLANRNTQNQAKLINNNIDSSANIASGLLGSGGYDPATDKVGNYGNTNQSVVDQYLENAKKKHVNGLSI